MRGGFYLLLCSIAHRTLSLLAADYYSQYQRVNAKGFYLLLYSKALGTLLLSPLDIHLVDTRAGIFEGF